MKKFFLSLAVLAMSFTTANADSEVIRRSFTKDISIDMFSVDLNGSGEIEDDEFIPTRKIKPCNLKLVFTYIKGDRGIADIKFSIGGLVFSKRVYNARLFNLDVSKEPKINSAISVDDGDNKLVAIIAFSDEYGNTLEFGDVVMFDLRKNKTSSSFSCR